MSFRAVGIKSHKEYDEFKNWRDNYFNEFKEQQVALALIYGIGLEAEK